jgi:hypothetical protein
VIMVSFGISVLIFRQDAPWMYLIRVSRGSTATAIFMLTRLKENCNRFQSSASKQPRDRLREKLGEQEEVLQRPGFKRDQGKWSAQRKAPVNQDLN